MTSIENMTSTQRQSWLILLADGAVFLWFWQKMTGGFSIRPIDFEPGEFGGIIAGVVILTVVLHTAISLVFEIVSKQQKSKRDERDIEIDRRGSHVGYRILQIGVGVVIVAMIMSSGLPTEFKKHIQLLTTVQIIFALMVVSYVADLAKHAVMIHGYGR
jgi:hypothetical protein